jgi:hypothetical protein
LLLRERQTDAPVPAAPETDQRIRTLAVFLALIGMWLWPRREGSIAATPSSRSSGRSSLKTKAAGRFDRPCTTSGVR